VSRALAALACAALAACGDDHAASADAAPDAPDAPDTATPDAPDVHVHDSATLDAPEVDGPDADMTDATDALEDLGFGPAPIAADPGFLDFFRHDRVQPIELRVTQAEWDAMIEHMHAYAAIDGAMRTGRWFRADMVYTNAQGHAEVVPEVGFRTRGNTTRVVPEDELGAYHRAHFKLKVDATFDLVPGTPEHAARDARRFRGVKELALKWGRDDDPSQIRELFAYEMFRRIGVPAPRTTPVALTFIIGDTPVYFGLYLGIEQVDKPFLTKRLGSDDNDGDLYKCLWLHEGPATLEPITNPRAVGVEDWERDYRPSYDLQTNEETSDHARLHELVDQLDALSGDALAAWLDVHFEVDLFLRWLAMNVLIGMPDDYWAMGNNYYLYFGPERGLFLPWDYDHGLGGGWGGEPVWSHEGIAHADIFAWKNLNDAWWRPGTRHPLVDKILVIPRHRERYLELLAAFIDPARGLFGRASWAAVYEAQAPRYAPWLVNDTGEGAVMERTGAEEAWIDAKVESVRAQVDAAR